MDLPNGHSNDKQRIDFVTGKGGVGKSVIAAARALKASQNGQKVLLAELGATGFYSKFFGLRDSTEPQTVRPGLDIVRWDGTRCLREYILYYARLERIVDMFFENRIVGALIRGAPALSELAILGKATSGVRGIGQEMPYDRIVIDSYATGHFMALLKAPVGLHQAVRLGPMGEQTQSILRVLKDVNTTRYFIVTLPEDLPVQEGLELRAKLQKEFGLKAQVFLNRMVSDHETAARDLQDPFSKQHVEELQRQKSKLQELEKQCGEVWQVPFFFESDAWKLTERLAEALP